MQKQINRNKNGELVEPFDEDRSASRNLLCFLRSHETHYLVCLRADFLLFFAFGLCVFPMHCAEYFTLLLAATGAFVAATIERWSCAVKGHGDIITRCAWYWITLPCVWFVQRGFCVWFNFHWTTTVGLLWPRLADVRFHVDRRQWNEIDMN